MPLGDAVMIANDEDDIDVIIDCLNARILCAISEASYDMNEEDRPEHFTSSTGAEPPTGRQPQTALGVLSPDKSAAEQNSSVVRSDQVQELTDEVRRQRIEISRLVRLLGSKQTEIDRLNKTLASKEEPEEISTADMTIIKRRRSSRFPTDDSLAADLAIMPTPRLKPERSCENHCTIQ
ncbi:hypothetical protein FOL47_005610 [Perkinsus chesapeaki]|uniref:Uncharacterized protein n=1 Tax=Perkinsus chesapeaki TaxID=330153 RepID=A0A7J6MYF0_PERCH|nr:hypothetical protein FOL47_005610 [Perkinsus chesapeaki]